MGLEERIAKLESLVYALITKTDKNAFYQKANTTYENATIKNNSVGVMENDTAICDVAELADVNSNAIDDLAVIIDELENRVSGLEVKDGQ